MSNNSEVLDQRSNGEELLVGFGEIDSNSDTTLSDVEDKVADQNDGKRNFSFLGRLRGGEKKDMDKTGTASVVSSSNNSFLSMTSRGGGAFRSRIKEKVENAFNKINRSEQADSRSRSRSRRKKSINAKGSPSFPPVVFFDRKDKEVSTSTINTSFKQSNNSLNSKNSLRAFERKLSGRRKKGNSNIPRIVDYGDFGRWKNAANNSESTLGYGDSDRWKHSDKYLNASNHSRDSKKKVNEQEDEVYEVNDRVKKSQNQTGSPSYSKEKGKKVLNQPSQEKFVVTKTEINHVGESNGLPSSIEDMKFNDVLDHEIENGISETEAQHKVLDPLHSTNEIMIQSDNQDNNSSVVNDNSTIVITTGRSQFKKQTSNDSYPKTTNKHGSMINVKKGNNRKNVAINPKGLQTYKKKIVIKSDATKQMIFDAIKSNILFILWTKQEIYEFIDTFEEKIVKAGETIFNEGDEGTYFYILESGSVNVFKQSALAGAIEGCGATFGDVALLYDAPRNSTFRAETKCKLWVIDRMDYRGVSRLNNKSKADQKIAFLKKVSEFFSNSDSKRIIN